MSGLPTGEDDLVKTRPSRVVLLLAVLSCAIGLAPVGLGSLVARNPLPDVAPAAILFWFFVLSATVLALFTRNAKIASGIAFVVGALALLNLAGCAVGLAKIARALG
jgi:hypothetical protein